MRHLTGGSRSVRTGCVPHEPLLEGKMGGDVPILIPEAGGGIPPDQADLPSCLEVASMRGSARPSPPHPRFRPDRDRGPLRRSPRQLPRAARARAYDRQSRLLGAPPSRRPRRRYHGGAFSTPAPADPSELLHDISAKDERLGPKRPIAAQLQDPPPHGLVAIDPRSEQGDNPGIQRPEAPGRTKGGVLRPLRYHPGKTA